MICRTLHLVDIPVGLQVFHIAVAGIGAHALYLMVIPEREGVVIAIGQYDGMPLCLHALQIVCPEVPTGIAS